MDLVNSPYFILNYVRLMRANNTQETKTKDMKKCWKLYLGGFSES